ncbi:glutathione S-transferase [Oceanicoccus sagamiensis]|uniref:glutathione S-transferase n=1 Tax=Oceanicoccus sagamiensis TaxID=716816 RepID=UPI001F0A07A3|nr:glutathione S-transferase [Oceanicoccus sagamiensis]
MPILYSFRRCPYAIRARMALLSSKIAVELREIILRDKPASMLEYSPKGTVPVLVLNDNRVIDESREIISWALQHNDPEQLLRTDKTQIKQLIDQNDGDFKASLDRYKYADRYPEKTMLEYRSDGEQFLALLEQRLGQHRFLIDDKPSVADLAIFPFIRQFAHVDKAWFDQSQYNNLQRWLNGFLESAAFERCMQKRPPWKPGDSTEFFQ